MKQNVARDETDDFLALFVLLMGLMCGFVLSLPVFPSQDGPMHAYYAHVLASLFQHGTIYQPYFYIRSLFPPYALHYYLLIFLNHFFSSAIAQKLEVCLILITSGFGFRSLAIAYGKSGPLASLFMLPLLFNWPLFMGFFNFSLSLGIATWALWCWAKIRATNHPRYYLAYFLLIVLMTVTHPVPLLIVLAIVGLDVVFVHLGSRWGRGPSLPKQILSLPTLCYVASCTSLIYVSRFTDRQRIEHSTQGSAISNFAAFLRFAKLSPLAIFAGPRWDTYCYRLCLYLILAGSVLIATKSFLSSFKERPRVLSVTPWMTMTIFLPVILMVIPRDLNGSHFFADRLLLIVWMSGLLAASTHGVMTKASQMTFATMATLVMLGTLLMANQRLRPISKIVAQQRSNPFVERPGSAAIDFGSASAPAMTSTSEQVSFNPYLFSHVQDFTDQDTVLLNSPWLDLPILPLAGKSIMLNNSFSPTVLNSPHELFVSLQHASPIKRQTILNTAQFLIFASLSDQQEIVSTEPESLGWHCVPYSNGTVCSRVQRN